MPESFDGAQHLLERARAAGEQAYPGADYDLAAACVLLARIMTEAGAPEQSLPLLDEARERFGAAERREPGRGAGRMASVCWLERGDCLLDLGRLDEAATAYEESIRRCEKLGNDRGVAVGKSQLASLRLAQRRYTEAIEAFQDARRSVHAAERTGLRRRNLA